MCPSTLKWKPNRLGVGGNALAGLCWNSLTSSSGPLGVDRAAFHMEWDAGSILLVRRSVMLSVGWFWAGNISEAEVDCNRPDFYDILVELISV